MNKIFLIALPIVLFACKKEIPTVRNTGGTVINPPPPPPPPQPGIIIPGSIQVGNLAGPRAAMASVVCKEKFYFANEGEVNIFDPVSNLTTVEYLSNSRVNIGAVASANLVFFAGGYINQTYPTPPLSSSRVDIYNTDTKTWNKAELSVPRSGVSGCAIGNKVFFAGGSIDVYTESSRTDIYDVSTNTWSQHDLSQSGRFVSVVIGNKIWFITHSSDSIDVYDAGTDSWSTMQLGFSIFTNLPAVIYNQTAITVNNKVYFIDGHAVRMFDIVSNSWSSVTLSEDKFFVPVGFSNNKIAFIGGMTSWFVYSTKIEIYDLATNSCRYLYMNADLYYASIISYNNYIYIAGGLINQENKMLSAIYRFSL